ncbi:MAG: adaptor protein MecA [Clostridiales bacterium]|nr:adaptor protein MecA [Clostridiales bacterium]
MISLKYEKMGDRAIRIVFEKEDLEENGLSLEDLLSGVDETREYLNHLIQETARELDVDFTGGELCVQMIPLPKERIAMMVSDVSGRDVKQTMQEFIAQMREQLPKALSKKEEEGTRETVEDDMELIRFPLLEDAINYCSQVLGQYHNRSAFYRYKDQYYLFLEQVDMDKKVYDRMICLASEYGQVIPGNRAFFASLEEHGQTLVSCQAVESLGSIA